MKREKALITMVNHHESFDQGIAALKEMGIDTVWEKDTIRSSKDPQTVIKYAQGYDYIFAGGEVWNAEVLDACPDVKMIVRLGVGYDAINLKDCSERGIPVTFMPGVNAGSVAELAASLTLSCIRRIPFMNGKLHVGDRKGAICVTNTLSKKVVGIMGFGNIGKKTALLLKAFGSKILAYDPYMDTKFAEENGIESVSVEEIYAKSDIISLHLPLTPDTRHIINAENIAKMKDGVIIINTSRGEIVNSDDLAQAVRAGKVAAAGLDVLENEGIAGAGSIFFDLDNVILTPHVGGVTQDCFDSMMEHGIEQLKAFKEGREIKWLLNPEYADMKKD